MPIAPQLIALIGKLPTSEQDGSTPELIDKICNMIPRHGLNNDLIVKLLTFIKDTNTIDIPTKVNLVEIYLLPNDYLDEKVINAVIDILHNEKYNDKYNEKYNDENYQVYANVAKPLLIACSQWLINVFFLWPQSCVDDINYIWSSFWPVSYLQDYITLLIIWSSNNVTDVKAWRIRRMWDLSQRSSYPNGKKNLSFILKRYKSLIHDNMDDGNIERIHDRLLNDLQIDEFVKPDCTWDSKYISRLTGILIQENPNKFSVSIIKNELNKLTIKLNNNVPSLKPKTDGSKILQLYDIKSADQLVAAWDKLKLPLNVEPLITSNIPNPTLAQLFIISKLNSGNNDDNEIERFRSSMFSWIDKNLTRCFYERRLNLKEKKQIINYTLNNCEKFEFLTFKVIDKFLIGDNLIADKDVFSELAQKLFLMLNPTKIQIEIIKDRIIVVLSSTVMINSETKFSINKDSTFAVILQSILLMLQNWMKKYESDKNFLVLIIDLINDIAKLILIKLQNSVENRFYSINMIMLLNLLIDISLNEKITSILDSNAYWNVLLQPKIVEKIRLLDDPLMLDILCRYLNSIVEAVQLKPPTHNVVQLINSYILDLTNYLWRNKIDSSKKLFNIPTEFIKTIADNTFFPNITNTNEKLKTIFSFIGIPALSFLAYTMLREIENEEALEIHYRTVLNERNFTKFMKDLKRRNTLYINDVKTFDDLKIELAKKMYKIKPYQGIITFLFTYMKFLKKHKGELKE